MMATRASVAILLFLVSHADAFLVSPVSPLKQEFLQKTPNAGGVLGVRAKTYTTKDFSVDWNRPDAAGSFGKVWFASQGFAGMGGQVVIKCPINDNFALTTFSTEQAVNQKLSQAFPTPRWAQFLGDLTPDPSKPLPADLGQVGLVFKKEAGASLEDMLVDQQNVASKLGCAAERGPRPALCKKVMQELLQTCVQLHSVGVMHRDIKPENVLVVGGPAPLKLIDFGSSLHPDAMEAGGSCDVQTQQGVKDISLDPFYAPPEKRIAPAQPGQYDVFSVAMTGMRCLLPSLSRDPRPGVNHRDPNAVTLFGEFAEVELPRAGFNLEKWKNNVLNGRDPTMHQEVSELFAGGNEELLALLTEMLARGPGQRPSAAAALQRVSAL